MKSARRFRLGPATTLAIAAGITIAYVKWPDFAREAQARRDLQAMRAEIAGRSPIKARSPHNLDTLWNLRAELNFSAAQTTAIAALRVRETREIAALKREVETAAREFSLWMKGHPRGVSLAEIQARSAIYSAKSAALAEVRGRFWERGLRVLTAGQRAKFNGNA